MTEDGRVRSGAFIRKRQASPTGSYALVSLKRLGTTEIGHLPLFPSRR